MRVSKPEQEIQFFEKINHKINCLTRQDKDIDEPLVYKLLIYATFLSISVIIPI